MRLYFYPAIVCSGVFGKSTWFRFFDDLICADIERGICTETTLEGSDGGSSGIGEMEKKNEKNVIPSSGFTWSRYTRLSARGKTLPVPNPPTTGNRRPFQFLLLSRLRFNFPFTPACFRNNLNPYLRVGILFTWSVRVRVC